MRKILLNCLLILIFIFSSIFCMNISIKDLRNSENKTINVEVKDINNVSYSLNLPFGTNFKDLIDLLKQMNINYGTSYDYSLNLPLYNNQVISFYKNIIKSSNLISINSASLDELMTLPGIGEKTALKIIEYRKNNGGFKYLEELKNVSGIGDKKYERIKELITI